MKIMKEKINWIAKRQTGGWLEKLYAGFTKSSPRTSNRGIVADEVGRRIPMKAIPVVNGEYSPELGALDYNPTMDSMPGAIEGVQPEVLTQQDYYPHELGQNIGLGNSPYRPAPSIQSQEASTVDSPNTLISWLDIGNRLEQGGPKYIYRNAPARTSYSPAQAVSQVYGKTLPPLPPRPQDGYLARSPYRPIMTTKLSTFEQPDIASRYDLSGREQAEQDSRELANTPKIKTKLAKRKAAPRKMESKKAKVSVTTKKAPTTKKDYVGKKKLADKKTALRPMKTLTAAEKAKKEKQSKKAAPLGYKIRKAGNKVFGKEMRKSRKENRKVESKQKGGTLRSNFKKTNYITEHAKLMAKRDSLNKVLLNSNTKKKNKTKVQIANNNIAIKDLQYWKEKNTKKKQHYTDRR